MAFRNQGTTGPTIVISRYPDMAGNHVCDGASDDIDINLALGRLNALGGGSVILRKGTYTLADPIIFPGNNLVLEGEGRATFIDGDGLSTGQHAIQITGRSNCTIRNLAIQTEDGGTKTSHCIFLEDGSNGFLIENVVIVDSDSDGIHIEGTSISGGTIRASYILDADNYGINVDMDAGNYADHIWIDLCSVTGCGNSNIAFSASSGNRYCKITNNISYSCTLAEGIYVVAFHHGTITDNICYSNATEGIQIGATTTDTIVEDNIVYDNGGHGIFLEGADDNIISGNLCEHNDSGNTATFDGIHVDVDSNDNKITENKCYKNHRYGIYVLGTNNQIEGNKCATNDRYGIIVSGADCQINDNECEDDGQDAAGTYHEIYLTADADRCMVNDNHITSPGDSSEDCIHLADGVINCIIEGNYCYNGMGSGIALTANNDDCKILGNYLIANDDYGVEITAATCAGNHVKHNHYNGNVTGAILDNGTDTAVHHIWEKTPNPDANLRDTPAQQMMDGVTTYIRNQVQIPLEFQELVTAQIVVCQGTAANPNMVWTCDTDWGKICSGEDYLDGTDAIGSTTTALAQDDLVCLDILNALDGIGIGDLIGVTFMRDGGNGADTVGGPVYYLGIRVRYV